MSKSFCRYVGLGCMLIGLFMAGSIHAEDALHRVWAIKDCRIVSMAGAEIKSGVIVVRDGLIAAVGDKVAIPADAEVIDGKKLTVYPGMIDTLSQSVMKFPEKKFDQAKLFSGEVTDKDRGINPEVLAFDFINLDKGTIEKHQRFGFTTVQAMPPSGILTGQSTVFSMSDNDKNNAVLSKDVCLGITFKAEAFRGYPQSTMGVVAFLRQEFSDAAYYVMHKARWTAEKKGITRPAYNARWELLGDYVTGKKAVIFFCNNQHDIRRALALAAEFKLNYLIADLGGEGFQVIPELKQAKARVLCPLTFKVPGSSFFAQQGKEIKDKAEKELYPKNAAKLAAAGIPLAFSSIGTDDPKSFNEAILKAIENGLPREKALRALTVDAAHMLGLDKCIGTLELGKIANLVICEGDWLGKDVKLKTVFCDGKKTDLKDSKAQADEKPTVNVTGKWDFNIEGAGIKVTFDFQQDEGALAGKMTSQFGVFDFTGGTVAGKEIYFEMTLSVGGQQMDLYISGTVEGDTIQGSVVQGSQGSTEFKAKRIPG